MTRLIPEDQQVTTDMTEVNFQTHLAMVANDDDVRVFGKAGFIELPVQPFQKQVLRGTKTSGPDRRGTQEREE